MPDDSDKPSVKIWLAIIGAVGAIAVALIPVLHPSTISDGAKQDPPKIVIQGVVMRDEANPEKRTPIPSVIVTATDGQGGSAATTTDGMFRLELKASAHNGGQIELNFKHADYQEKDVIQVIGEGIPYIFYLWPAKYDQLAEEGRFIQAFYTPAVSSTFRVPNRGNVRCAQQPCSPDGKWMATIVSATIDAGPGHVFASGRVDCIAGPCPWSSIETKGFPQLGQRTLTASVRAWSDTVTYRLTGGVR